MIPTSSFKATLELSLDLTQVNNAKVLFYAFSKQNGSSSSSRPTLLNFSTSTDGGNTFSPSVAIGDETTFPNNDSTTYTQYAYELPTAASGQQQVILKIIAERGDGAGSAAELIIDDFSIESQVLPLTLLSAKAESRNSVLLEFNQPVTSASAEHIENYVTDNGITINDASLVQPNKVRLSTSDLTNGQYQITATNIVDVSTETLSNSLTTEFVFIESLRVTEVVVLNKRTIEVAFNLNLDKTTAVNRENYSLDSQIGQPLAVKFNEQLKNKVTLTLPVDLLENSYALVINDIRDASTLAIADNLTSTFSYLPLKVSNLEVTSPTSLELTFNQKTEAMSTQLLANYSFNFGLAPILLSQSDSIITLQLNRSLVNNTYALNINDVVNLSGNAVAENVIVQIRYETATLPRQILINEIFADPSGEYEPDPIVLPNDSRDEYIELFNNSLNAIDISDFQLSGGTIGDFVLEPKDYVILTANSKVDLFQEFGDVIGVSSWNALGNNGEQIILTDNLGNIVDSLTYDLSWYQNPDKAKGGWSIEQINPNPSCIGAHNWSSSTSLIGGTPGEINSIYDPGPDNIAPQLIQLEVINDSTLQASFNEAMDLSTLNKDHITVSGELSIDSVVLENGLGTLMSIQLKTSFERGFEHSLHLSEIKDCSGNAMQNTSFSFYLGANPNQDELIFTEIMASPSPSQGLPAVEYLELLNTSGKIISLQNIIMADATSSTVLNAYDLKPNEYLILAPNNSADEFNEYGNVLGVNNWLGLNNGGEKLSIYDPEGSLIHSVHYSDSWYRDVLKTQGGFSLEMIDTSYPCTEALNWIGSASQAGGSPGTINSVAGANPDLSGPQIIQAVAIDASTVEIRFNERLNATGIGPNHFSGTLGLSFIASTVKEDQRSVLLTTLEDLIENTRYQITVNNIADCSGNLINAIDRSVELIIPAAAEPSDILLNEILFHPKTGGVRFVEIYNHSTKYINLKDWKLSGMTNSRVISEDNLIMAPRTYYTITNDGNILSTQYPNTVLNSIITLSSMPSLPSDQGSVTLFTSSDLEIDSFAYNDNYHSALLSDTRGVSLERIRFSEATNNENNWFSASSTEYSATPGYENSQSRSIGTENDEVSVEPIVFAPNSPREPQFASINYTFQTAGNTLNTSIIDAEGRVIKELGQNVLVGKEGFLTWDGSTNQLGQARVGYYMILTEVISPNGNIRYLRNKVAIGANF